MARFFMRGRIAGMHCSNCGREIAPFDAKLDTRIVPGSNPKFPYGRHTKIEPMWLCQDCAESREMVKRTLLWTAVLFFIGLLVLGLIGRLIVLWW
jgi:hypothetical protein